MIIKKKHNKYGLSKLNIMDYNFDNNFLYGRWSGPIIYDVLVRNSILVIQNINKVKFEKFCMMTFVRFYLWTFKQVKNKVFQESIIYYYLDHSCAHVLRKKTSK